MYVYVSPQHQRLSSCSIHPQKPLIHSLFLSTSNKNRYVKRQFINIEGLGSFILFFLVSVHLDLPFCSLIMYTHGQIVSVSPISCTRYSVYIKYVHVLALRI